MAKTKQDKKEQLEKKKLAERLRRSKIKSNPVQYELFKKKDRERHHENKSRNNIASISQLTTNQKKNIRERNKLASKRYREKKKNLERTAQTETLIDVSLVDDTPDPLSLAAEAPLALQQPENVQKDNSNISGTTMHNLTVKGAQKLHQSASCSRITTRNLRSNSRASSKSAITCLSRSEDRGPTRLDFYAEPCSPTSSTCSILSSDNVSDCSVSTNQSPTTSQNKERKFRYKMHKEFKILHKRIGELTQLNNKYRKQVFRLKTNLNDFSKSSNKTTSTNPSKNNKRHSDGLTKENKLQLEETVRNFYLDDENSRMCPGKKESITRNKIKKQKRYLTESIHNLHKKFNTNYPDLKISYSHFWKLKPFWVLTPTLKSRDTCQCKQHENMELLVNSLRKNCIINQKTSRDVLTSLCCNIYDAKCLIRECKTCQNKVINYKEFDNSIIIYYWVWKNVRKEYIKEGQTKQAIHCIKTKVSATPKNAIQEFENLLKPYLRHCSNIVSQSEHIKNLKRRLTKNEAVVHCDFSENYSLKYTNEIQAMHFGGSRQQITLHTVVIYYVLNGNCQTQAFCTVSKSLRHDAVAIWEHLLPILKFIEDNASDVDVIHFVSDSPSGQYRNRKLFYVISKLHWHYPSLRFVTWNYSESGHGKGAPDGVGAVLKRTADQNIARGCDIADLETLLFKFKTSVPGVLTEVIDEADILQKDLLIPDLAAFRGTMQVHQAAWDVNDKYIVALRKLSCGQDECAITSAKCKHGCHIGFFSVGKPTDLAPQSRPTIDLQIPNLTSSLRDNYELVRLSCQEAAHVMDNESAKHTVACSTKTTSKSLVRKPDKVNNLQLSKSVNKSSRPSTTLKKFVAKKPKPVELSTLNFQSVPQTLYQDCPNILNTFKDLYQHSAPNSLASKNVTKNKICLPKKTSNLSLVKSSINKGQNNSFNNARGSESSVLASDDSYWETVPSVNEIEMTPTFSREILSTLTQFNAESDDSDEDYNIF